MGLTILAALLRFSTLETQSYWYDEAITVTLVRRSLHGMLAAIPDSESTPPLYYMLAWAWSKLFGTGEAGLRSLSAVIGTATVPAAYAAAHSFVSRRSSLVTAALVAVSPFLVWYSQEARAYALVVLLGTLSLAFFRRALDRRESKWLTWWVITSTLAIATHYFAVFLVAAEAAWLLLRGGDRPAVRRTVAVVALLSACLAPLAVYQAYQHHTGWIPVTGSLGGRAAYFFHQLMLGSYPISNVRPLVASVPLLVLVGLFVWTERRERGGALLALTIGIVAVGIPFALAFLSDQVAGGRGDYFLYRNLIVATVPLTIPAATVVGTARAGKLGVTASVVACLLLIAVSIEISRRSDLQRPDIRAVAAALDSHQGSRAILLDKRTSIPLTLYRPGFRDLSRQDVRVREIEVLEEQDSSGSPRAALLSLPRFRRIATRHVVQGFTLVRLRAASPRRVSRSNLARAFPAAGRELTILLDPR